MSTQSTSPSTVPAVSAKSLKDMMSHPDTKKKFSDMLGERTQGFFVSVSNAVSSNDLLKKADPNSIMMAAAIAASLDLPIDPNLGFAYIVPYGNKGSFQMGYRGFIQLAQRSGQFKTISASKILDGQLVASNPLSGYEFDFVNPPKSQTVIGYAAYFKLLNGFEKTLYMTTEELKAHGTRFSQTFKKGFGLWKDDFDAMATKTVIKLLLSKFAPLSIQMQAAVVADQSVIKSIDNGVIDAEYMDNPDSMDIQKIEAEKQAQRIFEHIQKAQSLEELEEVYEFVMDAGLLDNYTEKRDELSKK
jgi:recombination protein RecT